MIDPIAEDVSSLALDVDAFIDASGASAAVQPGMKAVRLAGRVVLVGMGTADFTLPVSRIQATEPQLTGAFRYANELAS
ncbi:threonine dehydrogenase-like Zn-dependent dehydrogenase [Cryobacterium sp. MP_M5]|nr:threonine dehydrogenase-like Zn-dependent dehydrogenase [Cryobacterium sp. MP_M3]MEC5175408.1 threonine dehydrogenase-like Zn-dependent dehydrogenase [Cryobacterium sp. MP_M5]